MAKDLVKTLADLEEEEVIKIVEDRLKGNEDPLKILEDARKGMEIVGQRFASSEYFIPDLVYSGEILKSVTELVKPKLTGAAESKKLGKIVFGTVAGAVLFLASAASDMISGQIIYVDGGTVML